MWCRAWFSSLLRNSETLVAKLKPVILLMPTSMSLETPPRSLSRTHPPVKRRTRGSSSEGLVESISAATSTRSFRTDSSSAVRLRVGASAMFCAGGVGKVMRRRLMSCAVSGSGEVEARRRIGFIRSRVREAAVLRRVEMLALRRVLAVYISRTFAPLVCSSNSIIYRVGLELLMGVRIVALIEGNDGRQVRVNGCSGDIGNIVGVMDIVGLLVCFGGSAAYMAITGRQHDARVSRKGSIYL